MTFHGISQGDGALFAATDSFQRAFGQIQVLEIFQVLQDGFPDVEGLGPAGAPRELLQAFFDGLWKANGQHNYLAIQV